MALVQIALVWSISLHSYAQRHLKDTLSYLNFFTAVSSLIKSLRCEGHPPEQNTGVLEKSSSKMTDTVTASWVQR
jgi:hypothetical protein